MALPRLKRRRTWFISPSNKALATVPFPSGMVGHFLRPQIRAGDEWPGVVTASDHIQTTSGPPSSTSRWPNSTGAPHECLTARFSIWPARAAASGALKTASRALTEENASFARPGSSSYDLRGYKTPETSEPRIVLDDRVACWRFTANWARPINALASGNADPGRRRILRSSSVNADACDRTTSRPSYFTHPRTDGWDGSEVGRDERTFITSVPAMMSWSP